MCDLHTHVIANLLASFIHWHSPHNSTARTLTPPHKLVFIRSSVSLYTIQLLDMSSKISHLSRTNPGLTPSRTPTLAMPDSVSHAHGCHAGGFAPHTNVTLHGLSDARFNECAGVVMGYVPESGRHIVKLASGKTLKVLTRAQIICCFRSTYICTRVVEHVHDIFHPHFTLEWMNVRRQCHNS